MSQRRKGLQQQEEEVRPWSYAIPAPGELRALRLRTDLSQTDVAEHLGVSRQTIVAWESGDVSPSLDSARQMLGLYRATIAATERS